jgi:transposase InsO family protein
MGCRVRGSTGRVRRPARAQRRSVSASGVSRRRSGCGSSRYTRIYRPRTNGKAERFIQTLLGEWAYARGYRSSTDRARALWGYLRWYNRRRAHSSLRARLPISRVSHLYGHAS